jgi:hypothetical protein
MQSRPTYDDANLILRLYDLRREDRLRKARVWFAAEFKGVTTMERFGTVCAPGTDENASYRMVTTYWEMVASFVTTGVLNEGLLYESGRELLFVWERVRDLAAKWREAAKDPTYLRNLEIVGTAFTNRFKIAAPDGYETFAARVRGS